MTTIWYKQGDTRVRLGYVAQCMAGWFTENALSDNALPKFAAVYEAAFDELRQALGKGDLKATPPLDNDSHPFPVADPRENFTVTIEDLRVYGSSNGIELHEMLELETQVWPKEVDPQLLALQPTDPVVHFGKIGLVSGSGITNAKDYIEAIRETIARQADGFFTVGEAAQVLVDNYPKLKVSGVRKLIERILNARLDDKGIDVVSVGGRRIVRNSDLLPASDDDKITVYSSNTLVHTYELNIWVKNPRTGYTFPPDTQTNAVQPNSETQTNT